MKNFVNLIVVLWKQLSSKRRKQSKYVVALMLLSSFSEVISIGAILPFLSVISNPDFIFNHKYAQPLVLFFGYDHASQIVFPITIFFIAAVLFAAFIRMTFLFVMTRFSYAVGADITSQIYKRTLHQDFLVHLSRNSSEIITSIIRKTDDVIGGIITPLLMLISSIVLLISILFALFAIDPLVALISLVGFGLLYWIIIIRSRKLLNINSKLIAVESTNVVKVLQEGLGGIRDVILDGNQSFYHDNFRKSDLSLRRAQGNNSIISISPRYLMEALGMVLIALLAYSLTISSDGMTKVMPVLGALALAAQKMLPALQQVYASISTIRGSQASFIDVLKLLNQKIQLPIEANDETLVTFNKSIELRNIKFRYNNESSLILKKINLTIGKGSIVGFVGETGSGKSTLFDIIMGLLSPLSGSLLIDSISINKNNVLDWQKQIAHVPQSVFLSDASVAENIAFGCRPDEIDSERVRKAAKQAQISNFFESMPEGYEAKVGERGVKLSGGQRQRIGIARALYKEAEIIIFDEATSALDNNTESEVMRTIYALKDNLTILLIAHRVTTLQNCNKIVKLNNGEIEAIGSYSEVIQIGK